MPRSRIRLVASEAELTVKCPFMPGWRDCAHAAGGHRDRQRFLRVFAPETESHVRELLASVFGDDGSAGEDDVGSTIRVTALEDHRARLGEQGLAGTYATGLLWAVPSRNSLGDQAIEALKRRGVQMIGDIVGQRTAYAHAATAGLGVQEFAAQVMSTGPRQ